MAHTFRGHQQSKLGNVRVPLSDYTYYELIGVFTSHSRGAWFSLLNRIILSCVWQGVQSWYPALLFLLASIIPITVCRYGGQMVKVLIGSLWR